MRIEEIGEDNGGNVIITVKATRDEATESPALNWHQEVQLVKGSGVTDLLDEAARRLDESDCGVDWSRACSLKDLASEIRGEDAVTEQFEIAARKFAAKEKKAREGAGK